VVLVEHLVPRNAASGWLATGATAASGALPHAAIVAITHHMSAIVMVRRVGIASAAEDVGEDVGKVEEGRERAWMMFAPCSHRVKTRPNQTRGGKSGVSRVRAIPSWSKTVSIHRLSKCRLTPDERLDFLGHAVD
jgi:hypothetical protein